MLPQAPLQTEDYLHDFAALALLRIHGPDAMRFLQGQLTCDMREVADGWNRLGACCNAKGRIIASFRCNFFQDSFYLRLPQTMLEPLMAHLERYKVFFKVACEHAKDLSYLGVSGPAAQTYLEAHLPQFTPHSGKTYTQDAIQIMQAPGAIPRFEILGIPQAVQALVEQLTQQAAPAPPYSWQLLDNLAGIVDVTPDTSGLFTPHDLNYPALQGVSFNKGCYTGQEIIARMQYLGKLKQHLYAGTCQEVITPGSSLYQMSHNVGTVASVIPLEDHCYCRAVILDSATQQDSLSVGAQGPRFILCKEAALKHPLA